MSMEKILKNELKVNASVKEARSAREKEQI